LEAGKRKLINWKWRWVRFLICDDAALLRLRWCVLALALCAMGFLGTAMLAQTDTSPKDAAQDEHMVAIDSHIADLQHDLEKRREEALTRNIYLDEAIQRNSDRLAHDEGIAFGFFTAITVLQAIGLLGKLQTRRHGES
jgi:hypothetical protein